MDTVDTFSLFQFLSVILQGTRTTSDTLSCPFLAGQQTGKSTAGTECTIREVDELRARCRNLIQAGPVTAFLISQDTCSSAVPELLLKVQENVRKSTSTLSIQHLPSAICHQTPSPFRHKLFSLEVWHGFRWFFILVFKTFSHQS